jgi:hypothetical protein
LTSGAVNRYQDKMETVIAVAAHRFQVPLQLIHDPFGLDLGFKKYRPSAPRINTRIRKTFGRLLISWRYAFGNLLFNDMEFSNRRDVSHTEPAEKGAKKASIIIESACQRVRKPVLGLLVLVIDVSHKRLPASCFAGLAQHFTFYAAKCIMH